MNAKQFEGMFFPIEVDQEWKDRHDETVWKVCTVQRKLGGLFKYISIRPIHAPDPTKQLNESEFLRTHVFYKDSPLHAGSRI